MRRWRDGIFSPSFLACRSAIPSDATRTFPDEPSTGTGKVASPWKRSTPASAPVGTYRYSELEQPAKASRRTAKADWIPRRISLVMLQKADPRNLQPVDDEC